MPTISVSSPNRQFRRGYVACAHCRAHKVKCVLGAEPPCAKCRREHRQCVFDRSRRGPKTREAPRWAESIHVANPAMTADGDGEQHQHPPQSQSQSRDTSIDFNPNATTDRRGEDIESESSRDDRSGSGPKPVTEGIGPRRSPNNDPHLQVPTQSPTSLLERAICSNRTLSFFSGEQAPQTDLPVSFTTTSPPSIDPTTHKRDDIDKSWYPPTIHELSPLDNDTLEELGKIPYVRLGWFTAQEALTYLDIFHRHLAPYCPAFTDNVEIGRSHYTRIAQEPMLCTTILMTASRFFTLPRPGGLARGYLIHHRLWQQCERLIQLLIYGQEKHLRGNRAMGTIQSLLLLSEWHPRSLRSLVTHSQSDMWGGRDINIANEASSNRAQQSYPARYEKDLLDRANQSDRLSWMMVGTALNLAHEAGVFVDTDSCNPDQAGNGEWLGRLRIRKLLYVYVTNLSVRLGFQNTFTQDIILTRAILPDEGLGCRGAESFDLSMELWLSLVRLSRTASAMFFGNRSSTKAHLRNGDYIILLQSFSVTLSKWYDDFAASQSVLKQDIQRLLSIEYHNLKTYTHALAIEAVLDRTRCQNLAMSPKKDRLELLSTCYLPEDFGFIHQVINNSNIILQTTISMADSGCLRFVPARQLQCIMSAFLFLFKAISICTQKADIETSLIVLDKCVKALSEADIDEMDISRDTKTFLNSHVQRIREGFNAYFSAPTGSDQGLGAFATADLENAPEGNTTTDSQPFLLDLNWSQEGAWVSDLPTDLTTSWSSSDIIGRQTVVNPPWQLLSSPWDSLF